MHILFVLEHYFPYIGGAEKLFKSLTESMVKEGFEVTVLTTKHDSIILSNEVIGGVNVVRLPFNNRFLFTFFSFPFLIKFVKKCDIVHTTSYNAAVPAFFAGKFCKKPVYITFHEVWSGLWFNLPFYSFVHKIGYYLFEKMILKLPFDKYIAVSEYTKKCLLESGIKESKIEQIYNAIDYELIAQYQEQKTPKKHVFSYYGRLGASKGLDILLGALLELKEEKVNFTCQLIIPQYPRSLYYEIIDIISKYEIIKHIEIYHELSEKELYHRIQDSSFVVIPSYSEGFCFVAAECSALQIPVVSSGKGALRETVSGKYIELLNLTIKDLKAALKQGISGEWCYKENRIFPMTEMIQSYLKVYS